MAMFGVNDLTVLYRHENLWGVGAVIVEIALLMFFFSPDYFEHCASYVCPPLARATGRYIEDHFGKAIFRLTHDDLENNSILLKRYSRFISSLEFRGNEIKGKDVWHLLKHFTQLKRLRLVDVDIHDLPLNDAENVFEIETLQFVRCIGEEYEFARIVSACRNLMRLMIVECMPETVEMLSESIFRRTPKIQVLEIDPAPSFVREVSKPESSINHLAIQNSWGGELATTAGALAAARASHRVLVLYGVSLDEDFQLLAESLPQLPELQCCVIATEHQLPEEVRILFPNLASAKYVEEEELLMPKSSQFEFSFRDDYYYVYSRNAEFSVWEDKQIADVVSYLTRYKIRLKNSEAWLVRLCRCRC